MPTWSVNRAAQYVMSGLILSTVLPFLVFAGTLQADEIAELRDREQRVKETLEKVSPAVVSIADGIGAGSGVIVSEDGIVLTAGHVILTDAEELLVTMWDGSTRQAKPLGRNLNIDAGMVKLEGDGPYPHVELGSTDAIKQGSWCVALGHPGGYQLGRTPPVRLGRIIEVQDWMLITDCALVGGDSGGPLFDLDGKLIGINSSIGPSVAENRHSRIDGFEDSWDRLASGEAWGRLGGVGPPDRDSAYLGVELDMDAERAVVVHVVDGSAAETAGVKPGDIVLSLNDHPIQDGQDLVLQIAKQQAGKGFSLRVKRGTRPVRLSGKFGRYADQ